MPPSDAELTIWAREHLVYEGRMLTFAAVRLIERQGLPRDPESNALLESFVVHVRCLREFLWGSRSGRHEDDAFAADFCRPGEWEKARGALPTVLEPSHLLRRVGQEVVHLTYHRLAVVPAAKDWNCGEIFDALVETLELLSALALPSRLDDVTRSALGELWEHRPGAGTPSVATGATYGLAFLGATTPFSFHAGS